MSPSSPFDPHSPNAMFATILQRLDDSERRATERHGTVLKEITAAKANTELIDGRLTTLEHERSYQRGVTVVIASTVGAVGAGIAAWVKSHLGGSS